MNTLYFRNLFQNTKRGIAHTVSAGSTEGEFCLWLLCSNGQMLRDHDETARKFQMKGQRISALLLENLHSDDLGKVGRLLKHNQVERVFIPYGDSAAELSELALVSEVKVMKAGEIVQFQENGWNVWLKCVDNGSRGSLVLYHGPENSTRKEMDCLMAVKPAAKELPCQTCVDQDNHTCGMRCCLYNDFTQCKGHNGKDMDHYVNGVLVLGNVNLKEKETELREDLKQWLPNVRMVALADGGSDECFADSAIGFLNEENEQLNRYFIVAEGMEKNEKLLKAILRRGPRRIPVLTSEDAGLCVSGFLKRKEVEGIAS